MDEATKHAYEHKIGEEEEGEGEARENHSKSRILFCLGLIKRKERKGKKISQTGMGSCLHNTKHSQSNPIFLFLFLFLGSGR